MKLKKILIVLVTLSVLAATPLFADLYGTWAGGGTGSCCPGAGIVIYPWSVWKGDVYISEEGDKSLFEGEWFDELGNHGTFKGEILPISPSPDQKICLGEWTWYDPEGTSDEPVYGGDFRMTFNIKKDYCNGTWTTIWISPSDKGTMEGKRID